MKTFASLFFACLMAVSFTACGSAQPKADSNASTDTGKKSLKKFSGGRMESSDSEDDE